MTSQGFSKDEIIEMAKKAWADSGEGWVVNHWFEDRAKAFEAFAKLVAADAAAKEREACAKIVEESSLPDAYSEPCLAIIADEIRERGKS